MNQLPYYMTWQAQENHKGFNLDNYDGIHFHLKNGERIQDLTSTSYHTSFGGNPKGIVNRVIDRLSKESYACPKAKTPLKEKVSIELLNFLGRPSGKIYYTLSGSESVENALKMARQIKGVPTIVARKRSYHGATLGAIGASGDWRNQSSLTPNDWTLRIPEPYEDPDFLLGAKIIDQYGPKKVSAIIIEVISGASGVIIPNNEWLKNLQEYALKHNILIIADEVLTGFYRTQEKFAVDLYPFFKPDMICLGKNISGGVFPFGAVWTSNIIADYFNKNKLVCGSTNYAHPGGLAALEAVIEILSDKIFVESISDLNKTFENSIKILSKNPNVLNVRSKGLLAAIDLSTSISWEQFIDNGLYLGVHSAYEGFDNKNNTNQNIRSYLTLAPPYVTSGKQLITAIEKINQIIS